MDIRRRMINTLPTADNVFVIDSITFEELNIFGAIGYYSKTENLNTMNSLKNFFVENGEYDGREYELDPSKIELYLYDYKIPAIQLYYSVGNDVVSIYSSEGVFPGNSCNIRSDNYITNNSNSIDGEWTFDHIPTTSVEAILFVEFAKQYGVNAIDHSGITTWNEENKSLYMSQGQTIVSEYIIYGAGNGELTGHIEVLSE